MANLLLIFKILQHEGKALIPNLLTASNMIAGVIGIMASLDQNWGSVILFWFLRLLTFLMVL